MLAGSVDVEKEQARLKKELEDLRAYVAQTDRKLEDKEFLKKAPAHVVEEMRTKRATAAGQIKMYEQNVRV